MGVLDSIADWPAPHTTAVHARIVDGSFTIIDRHGDPNRQYRIASLTKMITSWAILVATEEGTVALSDQPTLDGVPDGATLEHLLSHAAGLNFDTTDTVAGVGRRRVYSNTGIELAAAWLSERAVMAANDYIADAVVRPLAMTSTEVRGSPAHGIHSSADDIAIFMAEVLQPRLVSSATADDARTVHFPGLSGIVPGVGRFDPCDWGLGMEIRGDKAPHWMGRSTSPATVGHFGGAGTMAWADPRSGNIVVALTDLPFDQWDGTAVRHWATLSDAVAEAPQ